MGQAFLCNRKGSSSNNVLSYDVICQATEPNKKEGRIWVKSSVKMNYFTFSNSMWSGSNVGHVNITGTPGGANPTSTNKTIEVINTKVSGIGHRTKINPTLCYQVQGSTGNWVSVDAYVCHSDTWIQFSNTRITPEFTYTGNYEIVDDSDNIISDFVNWTNNWKIRFLTSGTLTFTKFNGWNGQLDVFLVGGGGAGGQGTNSAGSGGGGGYTKTVKAITVTTGVAYPISIGAGGTVTSTATSNNGGKTSAFDNSVNGGTGGGGLPIGDESYLYYGGAGGSGGASYANGKGGTDGGKGSGSKGGTGQGTTTKEFGESSGKLYSGGGSAGQYMTGNATSFTPIDETAGAPGVIPPTNRGGGGGGSNHAGINNATAGGSGIAIIRNHREEAA